MLPTREKTPFHHGMPAHFFLTRSLMTGVIFFFLPGPCCHCLPAADLAHPGRQRRRRRRRRRNCLIVGAPTLSNRAQLFQIARGPGFGARSSAPPTSAPEPARSAPPTSAPEPGQPAVHKSPCGVATSTLAPAPAVGPVRVKPAPPPGLCRPPTTRENCEYG